MVIVERLVMVRTQQLRSDIFTGASLPETQNGDNGASLAGLRALVIEDSWIAADAIKSILESTGLDVVGAAGTLAEAERLSGMHELDIAVVDIELHGEMTYGLIEQLCDRGVCVVVVSGYELPARLVDKVAAVMPKPIRAVALLAGLRRMAAAGTAP